VGEDRKGKKGKRKGKKGKNWKETEQRSQIERGRDREIKRISRKEATVL
jgi:hypothetical protein